MSGPPKTYEELGREIGLLVTEKQAAYGDSFGKSGQVMRILYPDGISVDKMDDALVVVRIIDKLFRVATDRDALGESPFQDINGYSLLALHRVLQRKLSSSLAPETPDEVAQLRLALKDLAVVYANSKTACKLCHTTTARESGTARVPDHEHDPKCLLWEEPGHQQR